MISHIDISKSNLLHNYLAFKEYVSKNVQIVSVIKGNAYGHWLVEVATILDPVTDYFAVFNVEELSRLRTVSTKSTMVLGYVPHTDLKEAIALDSILTVYDSSSIHKIDLISAALKKRTKVQLKVDAALGRQGVLPDEIPSLLALINDCPNIELFGTYAHFANIEDTSDFSHAAKQIDLFEGVKKNVKKDFSDIKTHISSSAGTIVYEQKKGNNGVVRVGIGLYGMWPSDDLKQRFETSLNLKPVMRWVSGISQVRVLPPHSSIGYGLTYITSRKTKIAIIPQGYSDGYDRGLSNVGEVLISGTRCRILGRVMMNMCVADVSNLPSVKPEDEVVLLGSQGKETISAEEIAAKIGTINYEVTTRMSALLERVVIA